MKHSSSKQGSLHDNRDDINDLIHLAFVTLETPSSSFLEILHALYEALAALLTQIVICTPFYISITIEQQFYIVFTIKRKEYHITLKLIDLKHTNLTFYIFTCNYMKNLTIYPSP